METTMTTITNYVGKRTPDHALLVVSTRPPPLGRSRNHLICNELACHVTDIVVFTK